MKKYIIAIVAVAGMAGGCSSIDEQQTLKTPVPIQLTASVGVEAVTRGADGKVIETDVTMTRGIQENTLASGEMVYVWAKEYGRSSWDYLKAWTLTNGSTGLTGSTKYYPPDGTAITMNAVHGNFSETLTEDDTAAGTLTHSVVANQSAEGGYEKSDLLFGTATGSKASTSAENIDFTHKLSKIEVNLTAGYGYTSDDLATAIVRLNNVLPTVTINPTDGTLGSASGTALTVTTRKNATTDTYEAVIPPQTFANPDALIAVTTTKDDLTLTSTVPNDVATYASDTRYVYNTVVNILDPGIDLSKATSTHLGMVIAANGKIYQTKEIADYYSEGVAMIGHITSTGHGYALSLWNDGAANKSGAIAAGSAYTKSKPDGTTWSLPSLSQWCYIFASCGGSPYGTNTNCQAVKYYSGNLQSMMNSCGGEDFSIDCYWSSTTCTGYTNVSHDYTFSLNEWCGGSDSGVRGIRPCLTF